MKRILSFAIATMGVLYFAANLSAAAVKPGDIVTKENAARVAELVSPGNYILVRQGMSMNIVPSKDYNWPAPFWSSTEQYSPQVRLGPGGSLKNYLAGLPFPMIDANDPQAAQKIMWNFQFGPAYSDDLDAQNASIANYKPGGSGEPWAVYPIGHIAVYRNLGREEVAPAPTDYDWGTGIMQRVAVGPIIIPIEPLWRSSQLAFVWYRYTNPGRSDIAWSSLDTGNWPGPSMIPASALEDSFFGTLDFHSLFGFAGRLQDFDFKFLGEREMLAVMHAKNIPAKSCAADGGRTVCPEDWELRHVYVIEADARRLSRFGDVPPIAKRILYIDSQGWVITASDQYDHGDKLWKTLAIFNTVRDREFPDAKAAVYSFDRLFQTAMVDEDVQSGYSTILFTPNPERPLHDSWFINQGIISEQWIMPQRFRSFRGYFY